MAKKDNRWCLICNPRNRTLYWHTDEKTGRLWCWCNKCDRSYTVDEYCKISGIDMVDFLSGDFHVEKSQSDEVQVLSWPKTFIPLSDPRAQRGVDYLSKRGLSVDGDIYYDLNEDGLVFPYYYQNHFCGAQIRFIEDRVTEDGDAWKITTLPGTRLGLLFGMWNQSKLMPHIKAIVVCEGYLNALSLQQAFNAKYGGSYNNPWKFVCTSGSGVSSHHIDVLKELKQAGYKIFGAFDTDEAGMKGLSKLIDAEAITHFSSTLESSKDWNDILVDDNLALVKIFMSNIQSL